MKYQVMPELTPIEYEALKADIAKRGVLVPVEVDEDGEMLDGHHRVKAWQELRSEGVNLPDYPRLTRSGLTEEEKRNHARSLNVLRRHLSKEQRDEVMRSMRADGATIQKIADTVGVGVGTVHRALDGSTFPVGKVEGADGKYRPATYERKPEPEPEPLPDWVTGEDEVFEDDEDFEEPITTPEPLKPAPEPIVFGKDEPVTVANRPHVTFNSGNNEWYTPVEYIEAARLVMGKIDLDPASSDIANQTVQATTFYTAETDGLAQEWQGNVWLNPPYAGDLIGQFVAKLIYHVQRIDVRQAIVLVNNATETAWFNELISEATAVVFPRGRVRFWKPDGTPGAPLQGQALVYIGPYHRQFMDVFSNFGWCADVDL